MNKALSNAPHELVTSHTTNASSLANNLPQEGSSSAAVQQSDFINNAASAREEMLATGKGYAADQVHAYLTARVAGRPIAKPRPTTWRC